jgi:hypothetical protein
MQSGPIGAPTAHHPILQRPCLMLEQLLTFFAFGTDVKAYLGLTRCPIHQ